MWKILNSLFGWDFVLTRYGQSWGVRKVTWFYGDAFCRPLSFSDRVLINEAASTEGMTAWKPLTPNMFRYKLELQKEKLQKKI